MIKLYPDKVKSVFEDKDAMKALDNENLVREYLYLKEQYLNLNMMKDVQGRIEVMKMMTDVENNIEIFRNYDEFLVFFETEDCLGFDNSEIVEEPLFRKILIEEIETRIQVDRLGMDKALMKHFLFVDEGDILRKSG